ncbi:glycosyltransferase [Mangrovibacter sp. SLW1]
MTEEDMKSYQLHYKSDNGEYIYNYCHVTARMKSSFSNKRIVYIGRIDNSQKQLTHALDIVNCLVKNETFYGWQFDLYGTGNDIELIKDKIESLLLCDSVHLKGKYISLDSVLEKTDLLILTSKFEGLPLSLIEGALSGIPLISYNCSPGISDIIENGYNGYIIEQDNKAEFEMRLAELILDNEKLKKFGENSFSLAQRKFSKEVILQKWNSVLSGCELNQSKG